MKYSQNHVDFFDVQSQQIPLQKGNYHSFSHLKFEHDVDTLQYWDSSCFSFVYVWPVDFDRNKLCL